MAVASQTDFGDVDSPLFRAVIFDRDGVLTRFNLEYAADFFEPLLPITLEELGADWFRWGAQVGFPTDLAGETIFWQSYWDDISARFNLDKTIRSQLQQFDYTSVVHPFPDAWPALQAARQFGLRTGVLSNFSLASIHASLAAAGLADLVDVAHAAPVIGAAKPQPEAYLSVLDPLKVRPEECLFFDDEEGCVEGARRLGMHAYLVDRRRHEHALKEGIVSDLSALPAILAQMI